jgi:hypothetical protein
MYSLHPLVHVWCRETMSEQEQLGTRRIANALLSSSISFRFLQSDYSFRRKLIPHINSLLELSGNIKPLGAYYDNAYDKY